MQQASAQRQHHLRQLRRFEKAERARTAFENEPPSDRTLGADPYAIVALANESGAVGLLRGSSELALLDAQGKPAWSLKTLRGAVDIALVDNDLFVVSELGPELRHYRITGGKLSDIGSHIISDAQGFSAIRARRTAEGQWRLFVADALSDSLRHFALAENSGRSHMVELSRRRPCSGPRQLFENGGTLLVNCLIDHTIVAYRMNAPAELVELARIRHDGPFFSMIGVHTSGALFIIAGGVEDHPLDRSIGSFGYIDSFLYGYRIGMQGSVERKWAVNLSELSIITPKTLLVTSEQPLTVEVTGYGSRTGATLRFSDAASASQSPSITTFETLPGFSAVARTSAGRIYANPLLDAWISDDGTLSHEPCSGPEESRQRSVASRLGEALAFTYLMAPWNEAEGAKSRFTCETCHFEGGVDGRTHHTGRRNVRATTKPLRGLFNNRPHFSRALDPDLSKVAHNEFRVAGAGSGRDSWFSLRSNDHGWLRYLGVQEEDLEPLALRRALMRFLMDFTHRPNPISDALPALPARQRIGAQLFERLCEGCHEARLSSDTPGSRIDSPRWEAFILSPAAPIVWASDRYEKTGVEPYVHQRGARVPSLRRLLQKRPYFTNGSAPRLEDVLRRVRYDEQRFFHSAPKERADLKSLTQAEQDSLHEFLILL